MTLNFWLFKTKKRETLNLLNTKSTVPWPDPHKRYRFNNETKTKKCLQSYKQSDDALSSAPCCPFIISNPKVFDVNSNVIWRWRCFWRCFFTVIFKSLKQHVMSVKNIDQKVDSLSFHGYFYLMKWKKEGEKYSSPSNPYLFFLFFFLFFFLSF